MSEYHYLVNELYACVQGEGALTGTPMALVRLQGCNLSCPWCDTVDAKQLETTPGARSMTARDIVVWFRSKGLLGGWVLLTGGEPGIWDLSRLVNELHYAGQAVALETNGTQPITASVDWMTVSPKLDVPRGIEIPTDNVRRASELKFVVGEREDLDAVDRFLAEGQGRHRRIDVPLLLQPKWGVEGATELCHRAVILRGRPWRLSLQTHKFIGVD